MNYAFGCLGIVLTLGVAGAEFPSSLIDGVTQYRPVTSHRTSSSAEDMGSNGDSRTMAPGDTLVLLDVDGPGAVTEFWNTVGAYDPFYGRSLVLQIYYDGNERPSVQSPLGDFFGVGHGIGKDFTSLMVSTSAEGLSRTCYWRMPFREHIKITVTNESTVYPIEDFYFNLNWEKCESLPEDTLYFHAEYRQAFPAEPGHYTILDVEGKGQYVGTVYSVQQVETGWFGEGDDFIYIDGAETPQLKGTGTEDYFNDAWGFREFSKPFYGVSLYEGPFAGDRVSAYRWHLSDPIVYSKSLRVTIEHRGSVLDLSSGAKKAKLTSSRERPDWVSSVGFWYQYPPVGVRTELPPVEKRIAPYQVVAVSKLPVKAEPADGISPSAIGINYESPRGDAKIAFDFETAETGVYRINGLFDFAISGAVWQVYLDGKAIGQPMDMVVPGSQYTWHDFDLHELTAGTHTLSFTKLAQVSPTSRSTAFPTQSFTFEYLTLLRLEDMAGYHEVYDAEKAKL